MADTTTGTETTTDQGNPAPAPAQGGGAQLPATTDGTTTANGAAGLPAVTPDRPNPFKSIALLLKSVNDALSAAKRPGTDVRWVRIVRVRQFGTVNDATGELTIEGGANFMGKGVLIAVSGFARLIAEMMRFTLVAKDLLIQGDAIKALFEVSGDLIKTATSPDFVNSITAVADLQVDVSSFSALTGDVVDNALKYIDKVPEPEDIDAIGTELYKLLSIERFAGDGVPAAQVGVVDLDKTGKLRLMCWSLHKAFPVYVGKTSTRVDVVRLGVRDLTATTLDTNSVARLGNEVIYDLKFDLPGTVNNDIGEANALLEALGYADPAVTDKSVLSDELKRRLRRFQKLNDIPVNGLLDTRTLHQLMNLDSDKRQIRRARPYDALKLKDFVDTKDDPKPKP